jgi:hypothetical protein
MKRGTLLASCIVLAACSGQPIRHGDGSSSLRSFSLTDLAKSDIDNVVEIHQQAMITGLRTLALKLYKRNPQQWKTGGYASADAAYDALFQPLNHWQLAARTDWQRALANAWRDDYEGDRVGTLMQGLLAMTMAAYGDRTEFYMLSELDAQKLYNSARNIEAIAWKLSTAHNAHDYPLLLTNGRDEHGNANLSFEREFGKLIALQDTLARVIEDKNKRAIRFGVVNVATMVLLPI